MSKGTIHFTYTQKGREYREHNFNSKLELKKLLEVYLHKVLEDQRAYSKEIGLNIRTNLYNMSRVGILHVNANSNDEVNGIYAFYSHN